MSVVADFVAGCVALGLVVSPANPVVDEDDMGGRAGPAPFAAGDAVALLFAFEIAALSTCVRLGLMPHARQGGNGLFAVAVVGSKFEGTGFEKLQMTHTQVAAVTGTCSGCWVLGLPTRRPSDPGLFKGALPRFGGFGTSVTLGEDLRNLAYDS